MKLAPYWYAPASEAVSVVHSVRVGMKRSAAFKKRSTTVPKSVAISNQKQASEATLVQPDTTTPSLEKHMVAATVTSTPHQAHTVVSYAVPQTIQVDPEPPVREPEPDSPQPSKS